MATKRFELRVLLTVTTNRLLTKTAGPNDNGIQDLYDILGWMTNDSPFTHQLPRFAQECRPWLLRWFPGLEIAKSDTAKACLDALLDSNGAEGIEQWLKQCVDVYGLKTHYDVPRIPADDHEKKHPYDELVEIRGTDEGIVIVKP
jgi:hypothetical protein